MPETSNEIYRQMNLEKLLIPNAFGRLIKTDHQIKEAIPLFRKLEDAEINDYRTKFAGAQPSKKEEELEILVTGKDPEKVPEIEKKVEEQGNKVRQMKTEKKDKKDIDQAVTVLKHLKAQLAMAKGEEVQQPKKGKKK